MPLTQINWRNLKWRESFSGHMRGSISGHRPTRLPYFNNWGTCPSGTPPFGGVFIRMPLFQALVNLVFSGDQNWFYKIAKQKKIEIIILCTHVVKLDGLHHGCLPVSSVNWGIRQQKKKKKRCWLEGIYLLILRVRLSLRFKNLWFKTQFSIWKNCSLTFEIVV